MAQVEAEMVLSIKITASISETVDFIDIVKRIATDGDLQNYPEGAKVVKSLNSALQNVNKPVQATTATPAQVQTQA